MEMNPFNNSSMEIVLPIDYIGMTAEMQTFFESLVDDDTVNDYERRSIESFLRIFVHSEGMRSFTLEVIAVDEDDDTIFEQEFEPNLSVFEEDFYYRKAYEQVISNYHYY